MWFDIDTRELLSIVILISATLVCMVVAVRVTNHFFKRSIVKLKEKNSGLITYVAFSRYLLLAFIYFVAIVVIVTNIPGFDKALNKILAGSGVAALVIGFASKEAVGSIVSGFMILAFKPFVLGDFIKTTDNKITGVVEDITLRHTTIRTAENKRIIVPNDIINREIIENANYKEEKVCVFLEVGITYESDLDKAKDLMMAEVAMHPDYYDNRSQEEKEAGAPPVLVRVMSLGHSSVDVRAWAWAENSGKAFAMKCDLLESLKKSFEENGISIAYPHITVVNKD